MSGKETGSGALSALSEDVVRISQAAGANVVSLNARGGYPTSGTAWGPGYLVTADHVLPGDGPVVVTLPGGAEKNAKIVGRDPSTDIALLESDMGDRAFLATVDSASLRSGSLAIALSRNSEKTLNSSLAVINAVGGEWTTPYGGVVDKYVRLDVAVYAGFSGGPLVDPNGALIGIDTARLSRHGAVALPVSTVSRIVAELKEHGRIRRGYLGVASVPAGIDDALVDQLGLTDGSGLIIIQTEEGSGARKAGVLQGDILIELNGTPVRDPEELQSLLGSDSVGAISKARIIRGGVLLDVEIEVGERPTPMHAWGRGRAWRGRRRSARR